MIVTAVFGFVVELIAHSRAYRIDVNLMRNLGMDEGRGSADRGVGGSAGLKAVRSGNGRPLIALRCLLLMLVSIM